MANYKWSDDKLDSTGLQEIMLGFPEKMGWFISKGYLPHYYQALFHCDSNENLFYMLIVDFKIILVFQNRFLLN